MQENPLRLKATEYDDNFRTEPIKSGVRILTTL